MDVFKTKVGTNRFIPINEENYFDETGKLSPFYREESGKPRYHAVCPLCDNPITIIGLFKQETESKHKRKPHGKHHKGDLAGLASYNEDDYLSCPFHDITKATYHNKRKPDNATALALYDLMKDQFDRIVHIWNKTTGIKMSNAFAERLLRSWVVNESWRNYNSTYQNLPYMLIFAEPAFPLVGRLIDKSSNLYETLSHRKNLSLVNSSNQKYAQVQSRNNEYLDLTFALTRHKYEVLDEHLTETYTLRVRDNDKFIYSEAIKVDPNYLDNLIKLPQERQHRDGNLLEIAQRVMQ